MVIMIAARLLDRTGDQCLTSGDGLMRPSRE